jgi:hypothetical protein
MDQSWVWTTGNIVLFNICHVWKLHGMYTDKKLIVGLNVEYNSWTSRRNPSTAIAYTGVYGQASLKSDYLGMSAI